MRGGAGVTRCAAAAAALVLLAAASGCARRAGPPAIAEGTPCASCGMEIHDFHFACEREAAGGWRVYDSIECLLRDVGREPGDPGRISDTAIYLSDYDRRRLHRADSLWVVKGTLPTPMGGGLAAFLDRASAESVAAQASGRIGRLAELQGVTGRGGS